MMNTRVLLISIHQNDQLDTLRRARDEIGGVEQFFQPINANQIGNIHLNFSAFAHQAIWQPGENLRKCVRSKK
jgi:hypothetical protein